MRYHFFYCKFDTSWYLGTMRYQIFTLNFWYLERWFALPLFFKSPGNPGLWCFLILR